MHRVSAILTLFLPVAAAGIAVPTGGGNDRVDLRKGPPIAGVEIVSEDFRQVVYKKKGSDQTARIAADLVLDIRRDDEPKAYQDGRAALAEGDAANAASLMRLALTQAGDKAWVKEYASFYLGEALRQAGKGAEAAEAYNAVLAAKADSRFLPQVRLGVARASMLAKRYPDAEKALNDFLREIDDKRLPLTFKVQANILLARSLDTQGRPAEAAGRFGSAASEARSLAAKAEGQAAKDALLELALHADFDQGTAHVAAKNYQAAEALFEAMARGNPENPAAQALADIGAGASLFGRGEVDKARVRLTEAAMLHFGAGEQRSRALLLLARVYLELEKKGESGARKAARAYLEDLIREYPTADEVEAARTLLAGL